MREIDKIIIHCTATPEGREVTVEDVDRWHKERGFNSIGYHYLITLDGIVHKGRPVEEKGAHCQGYNSKSIGVCYVGGCDKDMKPKDTRTVEQLVGLNWLIILLKKQFPNATIHGHNEFSSKSCPCFDVKTEYGGVK